MKRPWARLRGQLMLSYLPLIIAPILLISLVTRGATEQGLTLLVTQGAERRANDLAQKFAAYYEEHGSWEGVSGLLLYVIPLRPPWLPLLAPPEEEPRGDKPFSPEQVLITDANGIVIASDNNRGLGELLSAKALSHGASILVNGKSIGTLVIGAALGMLDQQQRQILDTLNGALLAAAALSALLAAALSFGLSWQITRPVQQLMLGVRRLSAGEWSEPLAVSSQNEFGDLTRAFNSMASEVTHQQQLRRQMVADVAHDLRTPLSAMMLEVEAIEAGFQSPLEATASLREEITWLQCLVDDLRTLSLMDADQVQLQPEPTALHPFLCGVFDFWRSMADDEGRQLEMAVASDLPAVPLDPGRMRQVLGNLIDNAIRYTREGCRITLGARREAAQVVITVTDNGDGIAPADLPHIFDRFYRADRARQHEGAHGGTGLGLSIAHRLVELHHGRIDVQSIVGQGTTFSVSLPAA